MSKELANKTTEVLATITSKKLCETYSPSNCVRVLKKCHSVAQAMHLNVPTLSALKKQLGETAIEAYLKLWLLDLNNVLALKHPLKPNQIDAVATEVVARYSSLNVADIHLIFKRAKFGDYQGTYDRVSVPTIMKWFRMYFDERCNLAAEQSQREHQKYGNNSYVNRSSVKTTKQYFTELSKAHALSETKIRLDKLREKIKSSKD